MKKIFALMISMLFAAASNAQSSYKVSTDRTKKGILFEEFTGVRCHACSEGHAIAETELKGLRGQAHVVAIHSLAFSNVGAYDNYTTEDGIEIENIVKPQSFPSAMINRHLFIEDSYLYEKEVWHRYANSIKNDTASVNLYAEGIYDDATRKLNVHIEGYAAEDADTMRLSLLITQDYITGRQLGANGKYMEGYVHMHMLRDYITPVSGDKLDAMKKGEYFTRDYTYDVPEKVGETLLKAGDMNIIAFVTSGGMAEIENVTSAKPAFVNMTTEADAEMLAPDITAEDIYGYRFFEAKIRNKCSERITEAALDVTINGKVQEIKAVCDVAPFETASIKIPCSYEYDENGKAAYHISLNAINGKSITPTSFEGIISRPVTAGTKIKVVIYTDRSADENQFFIKDEDGNIIRELGPYPVKTAKEYAEEIVLGEEKTYCVEVIDYYGNGMFYGNSKASVTVYDENGTVIDKFAPVKGFGARSFFTVSKSLGITSCTSGENKSTKTYSLEGMRVNRHRGIVIKNGRKEISRQL